MKTSKRTRRSRTTQERGSGLAAATFLECGHPGLPNNLKDGKCGTCQCADEWDELAKETRNPKLKKITLKISKMFREGKMIYDRDGQTILEWEKTWRPHSNSGRGA